MELYCDYKKIRINRNLVQTNNVFILRLYPSEISKLIYRFHIWVTVTSILYRLLDFKGFKGSRKRKKEITLSKIRQYRKKGFEILYSELRLAKLNKGAYIPATEPQDIIINGIAFNLSEIEFDHKTSEAFIAILKLDKPCGN